MPSRLDELIGWLEWVAAEGGPPKAGPVADDFPAIAAKLKELEKEREEARKREKPS